MDEEALRILICAKLQDGRLPRDRPAQVRGGPGRGQICDGCGTVVLKTQMVIEGIPFHDGTSVKLHASCFQVWEAERRTLA